MHLTDMYDDLTARLRASGDWVWPLGLRLIMFAEFWNAGRKKMGAAVGDDGAPSWFANKDFPLPFDWLPTGLNWSMVAYGEVIFAALLLLGLFTRFAAFSLLVITTIAIASTHWPAEWSSLAELWKGYAVTDNGFGNYRIPLLFMLILLPLIFHGGGKLSLDTLLRKLTARGGDDRRIGDLPAIGLALLILAVPLVYLLPGVGFTLLALGVICIAIPRFT